MNDTIIEETLTLYEKTCSQYIDAMYHVAYVVLVDEDMAEETVAKVCVAGVHRYGRLDDSDRIVKGLFSDLYRSCRRKLRFYKPSVESLPPLLQNLTDHDRLLLAMRLSLHLSAETVSDIIGITAARLSLLD